MYRLAVTAKLASTLCLLFLLPLAKKASAAEGHFSVQLQVTADDTEQKEITSYLSRELRHLGDIEIVDEDPVFIISVVAIKLSANNGRHTGYALSVVLERTLNDLNFSNLFGQQVPQLSILLLKTFAERKDHKLLIGGPNDLENLCRKIITLIDSETFEKERKNSKWSEALKKRFAPTK